MTSQVDILVVGAGMVGQAAALALAHAGLEVTLLDAAPEREGELVELLQSQQAEGYDPRVSALTRASERLLKRLEAWPGNLGLRLAPYRDMHVWDGLSRGKIHFSASELHELCLGHIVENRVTQCALQHAVERSDNITFRAASPVAAMAAAADGRRSVTLASGEVIQARLVVAADGANSRLKHFSGLPSVEWDYGHHALVTTVTCSEPHQDTAWQRFTEDGPLALLPLPEAHRCSIVWSTSPDHAASLMAEDEPGFCRQLTQAFESRLGAVLDCEQRYSLPLRQRHACQYVQPGLAVIGDAAHTIHPLAGQGVNLGLMDAAALAEQVATAAARGEDYHQLSVLRRFQRQRQGANIEMAATMELFKQLFDRQPPLLQLARSAGMNLLDKLSPVKQHVAMQAMGLRGELPQLAR